MRALYLADKSALARLSTPAVDARLSPLIESGEVATCSIVDLEILYSARSGEDFDQIRARRRLAYERVDLTEEIFQRAIDMQARLARTARHRIPIPDLVIAAAAESAGLVVLHYDADFDRIAQVSGQPMEWVVPRGSV